MKKLAYIVAMIFTFIIIGILVINVKKEDTEITRKKTKIGFVLNGKYDDHSWGQAHYEGIEKCVDELNLEVIYKQEVPEDERCCQYIEELISAGCEIIFCNSFGYGEWEMQEANMHPEVYFFHATGVNQSDNLATYFGRIYQMRYLSGIVAGLQTQTNEIGYVAAFPISEVNRGINAFTLGVRSVNSNANVYVKWSYSWTDEKETETAVNELIDSHNIDVLAMHSDAIAPLEIAEERGIWSIGYNMDNSELFPNTFLTAPVWKWENFYKPHILECLQRKFNGKHYWEGVEKDVVTLSPLTDKVKKQTQKAVDIANEKLKSGTFDVFYGPIVDNKGIVRIADGESMTDYAMLNEFDWYVEGVVLDE